MIPGTRKESQGDHHLPPIDIHAAKGRNIYQEINSVILKVQLVQKVIFFLIKRILNFNKSGQISNQIDKASTAIVAFFRYPVINVSIL